MQCLMSEEARQERWPARNARNTKINLTARQMHVRVTEYSFSAELICNASHCGLKVAGLCGLAGKVSSCC
jgi:hypothetical protein